MVTIHMLPIYSSCTALQYTTFLDIVAHFTQIFFEGSKKNFKNYEETSAVSCFSEVSG